MDMEGLSTICAGLGMVEEDDDGNRIGYTKGEFCLDNLKDLLRFLRRDDPQKRVVFKQVCKWNTVGKDLIPIIEHCQDDRNLVLNAVKVLVFLTMPIEPTSNDIAQQVEYLWELKTSVTFSDTVAVTVSLLETPLENLDCEAFTEDDWKLVQLVITLYRNFLAIQDISMLQKAGEFTTHFLSLRDRFLELLFHENVMDLILVLTQHVGGSCGYFRQDNLLLLETFHYTFLGQEPELIAKAALKSSNSKVDTDRTSVNGLKSIMEAEEEKRKLTRQRNLGCHSQFCGSFTRITMDGSKTLVKGNPCSASSDTLLKPHQNPRGPLKRMVWDHGKLPSTNDKLLELLHKFVNQFLSGGYNVSMQSIHDDIEKEHQAIENSDVLIFFQVAQFVTSFQYHKFLISKPNMEANTFHASVDDHADGTVFEGNMCGPIAASMNESMFQLVFLKWRNAFEGLKETSDHKFLSIAGSLMKTMIRMLDLVLKISPEDSREPQTARIILYKLFYDQTEQGMTQFLLNMIKSFDTHKQAKSDLVDLVETMHVVIRLMENLQERGTIRVSKKKRKKRTKKTVNDKKDGVDEPVGDNVTIPKEINILGCEQSLDFNMSGKEKSTNPNIDGKEEEIESVQIGELKNSDLEAILNTNLPEMKNKMSDHNKDDPYYETCDSSGDEPLTITDEVDFKVSTLVSALANNTIIRNLCWLLKFYRSNSSGTNHHIITMLRRICDDLELSPMLYQLSLLTTFYGILAEQKSCPCKEYENIVIFLTTFVRRMLRKMKNHPLLFVEALFWKTRKECHYINCESWLHELGKLKKESAKWGSVSKDGEVGSSRAWTHRSIADALGDDEADALISNDTDKQKEEDPFEVDDGCTEEVEEHITTELNDLKGEWHSNKQESGNVFKRKRDNVLDDELARKIKGLYEGYKNNDQRSRLIAEALDQDGKVSPAQVSNMLRQLGLKSKGKKKMLHAGGSNQVMEGSSSLGRSLNTRKRVRAFSEDQEMMIKALFEQFKDHKRCSYMIANAMDAEGTFTTAQVSRKLKQLGLHVPRQKKLKSDLRLRDDDLSDDTDNETLLSMQKKRSKKRQSTKESDKVSNHKENLSHASSDDEVLSSLLEGKKRQKPHIIKESDEVLNQKIGRKLSRYTSDDNVPSSPLGNEPEQSHEMEADEFGNSTVEQVGKAEEEASDICIGEQLGTALVDKVDDLQPREPHDKLEDLMDDELVDFEDDVNPVASQKSAGLRRKFRIDLEDDE